jgi:cache domain-containing protein
MAKPGDDDTVTEAPPPWLERLAASCLGAEADDSRLGDLSEQYVRTHQRLSTDLGTASWAMAIVNLAADLCYLASAANVMLFARAVDPGLRLAEDGTAALIALELRERTMEMLRFAAHRLVLPAVLLLCSALLINSAVEVWYTWRQTEALMASVQREKAAAVSQRIDSFVREIERQIGWVAYTQFAALPVQQRRFDYVRLLRQVPAITELVQLDGAGQEQLQVSRLSMDVVGANTDRSATPAFIEATAKKIYFGPVYFRKGSEPYVTMAVAHGGRSGVTVVEVNLKSVWEAIKEVKVGETGYAYVVDGKGRLIADRDEKLMVRGRDLSTLPQVAAALTAPPSGQPIEGKTFDAGSQGATVLSAHAAVPALGWQVFVDLPAAETQASFWSAVIRGASLLGLGLVAALLAILVVARPITLGRPTPA